MNTSSPHFIPFSAAASHGPVLLKSTKVWSARWADPNMLNQLGKGTLQHECTLVFVVASTWLPGCRKFARFSASYLGVFLVPDVSAGRNIAGTSNSNGSAGVQICVNELCVAFGR